jgi:2-C-methyl-D-erythritol 4-phosphate cytidylyltransferase / 2-C-methyl-D-erythritol 2,4-cyclodiphosphate synthase
VGATFALLLAAGSGTRIGRSGKAFIDLGGIPMVLHSYRSMAACRAIEGVVILVPVALLETAHRCIQSEDADLRERTIVRAGGGTRQASVHLGLEELPTQVDAVICHDAARPFASSALFDRVVQGLEGEADGVIPMVPVPDTIKRVRDGIVVETLPRHELGLVQTPQAFRRAALEDAHRRADPAGPSATDDAMLLEAAGYRVAVVEGEPANFKITAPEDLLRAEHLMAREGMA